VSSNQTLDLSILAASYVRNVLVTDETWLKNALKQLKGKLETAANNVDALVRTELQGVYPGATIQ